MHFDELSYPFHIYWELDGRLKKRIEFSKRELFTFAKGAQSKTGTKCAYTLSISSLYYSHGQLFLSWTSPNAFSQGYGLFPALEEFSKSSKFRKILQVPNPFCGARGRFPARMEATSQMWFVYLYNEQLGASLVDGGMILGKYPGDSTRVLSLEWRRTCGKDAHAIGITVLLSIRNTHHRFTWQFLVTAYIHRFLL